MAGISITDATTQTLGTALNGLSARQRVTNNNIANIETPGYKAGQVSFSRALSQARGKPNGLALNVTNDNHLQPASAQIQEVDYSVRTDTVQRLDGNNVDLESELSTLAETAVQFQAATQLVSKRLAALRTAINEGRR